MSDDEEEFNCEMERARRNDGKRTGVMRPFLKSLPPDAVSDRPGTECAVCEKPLNCIGLCLNCRQKADEAHSRELDDLCRTAVQMQRKWFAAGKPGDEDWRSWDADKKWLRRSGFLLTVQAIEERWDKDQKGGRRRVKEADL